MMNDKVKEWLYPLLMAVSVIGLMIGLVFGLEWLVKETENGIVYFFLAFGTWALWVIFHEMGSAWVIPIIRRNKDDE